MNLSDKWDEFERRFLDGYFKAWHFIGAVLSIPLFVPFLVVYLVRRPWKK